MQPGQSNLVDLLGADKREFFCPPIQREYVWTNEKRQALLDDLNTADEAGGKHFTGTLITSPAGNVDRQTSRRTISVERVLVVDGQQRLTTLSILLSVALRHLSQVDDQEAAELCNKIQRCLFLADTPKIVPTEADREAYRATLKGEPEHGTREINKAGKFFDNALKLKDTEGLIKFTDTVLSNTQFVVIALGPDEDPCEFFAAANGRGTPLSPAELTKNLLLMKSGEKDLTAAAEKYWKPLVACLPHNRIQSFVNDVTYVRHGWMSKPLIYRKVEDDLKLLGLNGYFKELTAWRDAFQYIEANLYATKGPVPAMNRVFRRLSLVAKVLPPGVQFIWAVPIRLWLERKLNDGQLTQCLEAVDNYAMRMLSRFGVALRDLAGEMPAVIARSEQEAVGAFIDTLYGHEAYRSRTDDKVRTHLQDMRYAKGADRAWVLACLLGIEKDLQPDGWPDDPSVEHIAPKNLGSAPAWKHLSGTDFAHRQFALGNLTVLSQQDNMDAARVSFEDKCKVFENSMLRINRDLAKNRGGWGSAEIDARTEDICDHALKLWPHRSV